MSAASTTHLTLDGYQLRLPVYEGPLDVLLRLIEREQLAISEVSLLAIFDQFIAFIHALESPQPDVIAEFIAVAGRLSLLKSRSLLPRPTIDVEEPDDVDLVRQLEEYRAVKAAGELLADRQRLGAGAFGRGDGIARPAPAVSRLIPQPSASLARAVFRWMSRVPESPVHFPLTRGVTLREMISRIFAALEFDTRVSFDLIRGTCRTRQDTAVAFLAILTLLRRQAIEVSQQELFGPIAMIRPIAPIRRLPSEDHGLPSTEDDRG
jgi:segregation and condensation protein A